MIQKILRCKRAYAALEYIFFIVILMAALIGLAVYMKQALQGQAKKAGEVFTFGRTQ